MKILNAFIAIGLLIGCKDTSSKSDLDFKEELSKPLNEISGITADGTDFWVITDKPKAVVYKINSKGKVEQEVTVTNAKATDVEAVANDTNFVYIGDVGDNEGNREERQIIKIAKSAIGTDKNPEVAGEIITFRFSDDTTVAKKKKNNYDCESLLSYGDSLYLFTKRRGDMQTELFSLPKIAGYYTARSVGVFDSQGLITDAAINPTNSEVALTGYNKGHKFPFILLLKNFQGCNFFTGETERIELADKPWDWQIESITYNNDGLVYFACEETKEVKSTLYAISRDKLIKLNKKRE
jgi:hypothetical protein